MFLVMLVVLLMSFNLLILGAKGLLGFAEVGMPKSISSSDEFLMTEVAKSRDMLADVRVNAFEPGSFDHVRDNSNSVTSFLISNGEVGVKLMGSFNKGLIHVRKG